MPKTTKLGGPSHDVPASVVAGLIPDDVPKGLSIADKDQVDLTEDEQAKVDLGQAKIPYHELGEAGQAEQIAEAQRIAEATEQVRETQEAERDEEVDEDPDEEIVEE